MKAFTIIGIIALCMTSFIGCYEESKELDASLDNDNDFLDHEQVNVIDGTKSVLFAGDSRFDYLNTSSLPFTTYNLAKGGSTTNGCIKRLPYYLAKDFDVFVLEIGVNDIFRLSDIEEIKSRYIYIIDTIKRERPDTEIVCMTVVYCGSTLSGYDKWNSRIDQFNKWLIKYCLDNNYKLIDLNSMMSENGAMKAEFDDGEGIHYSAVGKEFILKILSEELS